MSKIADSLNNFWNVAVKPIRDALNTHSADTAAHVTAGERSTWNAHTADTVIHVTAAERSAWNSAAGKGIFTHTFTASDWSGGTISIPAATHGLAGSEVLYGFYHLVNGSYLPGTWACLESWAEINASTHVVTLHGPTEGYAGKVVLSQ